ncbi:MAG: hypothetical protein GY867_04270 [bacterium]|nr:hypothetical protein [bacterium]
MKAHLVQKETGNEDLGPFLDRAQEAGAGLVCFGELATSGCLYEPREVATLESHLERFRMYDLRIMVGLPLKTDEGLRNTYLYYHKGAHQLYHKINLFPPMNEPGIYAPGQHPGIWETDFGRIGAAICYDLRFPEIFKNLVARKVDLIFVPAAFPKARINDWRELLIERARESRCRIVGINAVGDDGTNVFGGTTMVVDPEGNVLAQADEQTETVLEVEL